MKLAPLGLGLVVLFGGAASFAQEKPAATDKEKARKEVAWAKNYKEAVEQARKSKKLIMVDFYTDWCGWCKKLDTDTYTDAKVMKLADESFVSVKLDAEKDGTAQAARYKVTGFPTILFLDPAALPEPGKEEGSAKEGEVVGKIVGYMPGGPFADEMKKIETAAKDFPKLTERVQKDPSDVEAIGRLAVMLHQRGDIKKAAELLDQGEKLDPKNAKGLLTLAYNAVADDYQEAQKFDQAIPLFRKAAETGGKDVEAIAYALTSIAVCQASQQKFAEAIPDLESVLKLEGISKDSRMQAEQMLMQLRQVVKQKNSDKK